MKVMDGLVMENWVMGVVYASKNSQMRNSFSFPTVLPPTFEDDIANH